MQSRDIQGRRAPEMRPGLGEEGKVAEKEGGGCWVWGAGMGQPSSYLFMRLRPLQRAGHGS